MTWFVLNFIPPHPGATPESYVRTFNADHPGALCLFAPKIHTPRIVKGTLALKEKPLTYHYVFMAGELTDVKKFCAAPDNGFSLLIDYSSSQRYAIVSEEAMQSFMTIARLHDNSLPFYDISDIDLEEGDLVKVIGGQYDGLTGTFLPRHRSNKGNLVIAATSSIGSIVWDIEAKYVRILKFAHNTRRQYDILEAFLPRLLPILDKYKLGIPLDSKEKSLLNIFNLRMGAVTLENKKIEAKLLATLICVQTILGDTASLPHTRRRFERRLPSVTNPATLSLISRLLSLPATPALPAPLSPSSLSPTSPYSPPSLPSRRPTRTLPHIR